jgi:hypothetical protein
MGLVSLLVLLGNYSVFKSHIYITNVNIIDQWTIIE